jgi:hypothetical protein
MSVAAQAAMIICIGSLATRMVTVLTLHARHRAVRDLNILASALSNDGCGVGVGVKPDRSHAPSFAARTALRRGCR